MGEADVRARPGRRTVEERQRAVLEVLAGKAAVDQVVRRLGVHASIVEARRREAMVGVEQALRRGSGTSAAELEFERKHRDFEKVVTRPGVLTLKPPSHPLDERTGLSATARRLHAADAT